MQNTDYRESLEDAVRALHRAEIELFSTMVNLGFKGTYADISLLHEVGEVLDLDWRFLKAPGTPTWTPWRKW